MIKTQNDSILGYQRLSNLLFSIDHVEISNFIGSNHRILLNLTLNLEH